MAELPRAQTSGRFDCEPCPRCGLEMRVACAPGFIGTTRLTCMRCRFQWEYEYVGPPWWTPPPALVAAPEEGE